MSALKVAELAAKYKLQQPMINSWIVKYNIPLVTDKPRTVDEDVFEAFLEARAQKALPKPEPKASGTPVPGSAEKGTGGSVQPISEAEWIRNQQLLLWDKRTKSGYAVGVTQNLDLEDEYVDIISSNCVGQPRAAATATLVREIKEGKLFFATPAAVMTVLLIQMQGLVTDKPELAEVIDHLQQAIEKVRQIEGANDLHL